MGRHWTRFEQSVKRQALRRLEHSLGRSPRLPQELDVGAVRRILAVRQHDQIGDFLLATPALRALRERWPAAHIGLVVRGYFEDAVRENPHVDETFVFPEAIRRWTPAGVATFLRGLRRGWDLAVVLNTVSHSLTSDLVARASGASVILGSEHLAFHGCDRNFMYDLAAPYREGVRHQTERNLDIVRYIGADTADLREVMTILPAERETARLRLEGRGLREGGPVVGIHPGAGKIPNRWPVARFAELADRLHDELGAKIVLFWGKREGELAAEFLRRVRAPPVAVEPGPIRGLAATFAACDVMIVNDTGVMHIAAACGVPLVAIFGPTDPDQWKPIGDRFVAVRAPSGRTEDVGVEDVFGQARERLQHRADASASSR